MDDPVELARLAVGAAQEKGAEHAEAWVLETKRVRVSIKGQSIQSCDVLRDDGVRVHAYIQGGRGAASAMGSEPESARTAAEWAVENARVTKPDPDFEALPPPASAPEVGGLFDPAVEALEAGELVEMAVGSIDAARELDAEVVLNGSAGLTASREGFANSRGVETSERSTMVLLSTLAVVKRPDGDVGSFFDYRYSRNLADFDPAGVSRSATEKAIRFLGAKRLITGRTDLVLGPLASHFLLSFALCHGLNAESIQRDRSCFAGKRGTKIGPDFLTLTDDPLIPGGIASRSADAEGTPSRKLVLMRNGVLETYLHNAYTAHKGGEENTGHAAFHGLRRPPSISPTNVIPVLGDRTAEAILRDTEKGIYVDMGFLFPNPATGDISGAVDFGFRIEGGERVHPVKNTMVGTNIFEVLSHIDAVSSDYRQDDPGSILPTIRVRDIQVAGGKPGG
ncbi:MAG: TldD/PmbA family protein [Planctomycetota bacterium]|jgi:PmbA protein